MNDDREPRVPLPQRPSPRGLCPECAHVRRIESAKGSVFWLCELAKSEPRLPRYPAQPRMECFGFRR